jgi:peptidoglycan/LPS O-acetylase OafA/YrhL
LSSDSAARVSSVDGLRGLLAGFVMFAHYVNSLGDGRFIGLANLCVIMFFVISGYVLTRGWRGSYIGFLVRRFLRLWPLYALCIAVGGWFSMNMPTFSLYFWYPLMGINAQLPQDPPTWSLFIEAWAMPFMPLIIYIARRPLFMFPVLVALVAAQFWSKDLYYGAFFIIGSYFADRTTSSSFLDSAPVQWLGRISYSLYLSHVIIIGVLKHHLPGYWMYLAVPVCLAIASALCLIVERPSIYLSRRAGRLVDRVISGVGRPAQIAPA